jgi:hypothetical protein
MTRKLKFETPINVGKHLHGTLLVKFLTDDDQQDPQIEIDQIIYSQAHRTNNRADITYLVREHATLLYYTLKSMAKNLLVTEDQPKGRHKIMEG